MRDSNSMLRPPSVIHLSYADSPGGAAIGARRSHQAMLSCGVDSRLVVVRKNTDDPRTIQLPSKRILRVVLDRGARLIGRLRKSDNPVIRTFNVVPTGTARFLNRMSGDIIQMHWVAADTISIGEIAQLNKPVVWKLPDTWAFSGTEHYTMPGDPERYREGYLRGNRPAHESGFDFDRMLWNYKRRCWQNTELNIVGPSRWITDCAKNSQLFGRYRTRHIPNPIDTDLYLPQNKQAARERFVLPERKQLIMFGAMNATDDRRKGFHYLRAALERLSKYLDPRNTAIIILGANGPGGEKVGEFTCCYLGTIANEQTLVQAYNAADVFVLPSEADNLPNTIKEASCCGVACVGFDVGGLPDMISHRETGYLATPYDVEDLAKGIAWAASHAGPNLSSEIRKRAVARHGAEVAVGRYLDFYHEILAGKETDSGRADSLAGKRQSGPTTAAAEV